MSLRLAGSLLIVACFLYGAHSSPSGLTIAPKLQKIAAKPLTVEGLEEMFGKIWEKYSQGSGTMTLLQLNQLLHDTDQEQGPQVVHDPAVVAEHSGVDPGKGLSKFDLLTLYYKNPPSSIKRDFFRIFHESDPPTCPPRCFKPELPMEETEMLNEIWAKFTIAPKLQKMTVAAKPLTAEGLEEMFGKIWEKYSQGSDTITLPQLNQLLHDTDQEQGPQVVDEEFSQSIAKTTGVDPSKGISKFDLLTLYYKSPPSSIKRDFLRIFHEGAPPICCFKPELPMEETEMLDEVWAKFSKPSVTTNSTSDAMARLDESQDPMSNYTVSASECMGGVHTMEYNDTMLEKCSSRIVV